MVDPHASAKAAAARAGVQRVRPGQRVALGTGSTAELAIRALARRFPSEGSIDAVASSEASARLATELGLPVRSLRGQETFDVMLDGADEVAPDLSMVKGGGGALFREKLLARMSLEVVILIDESKEVERLGVGFRVPVEIVPFARPALIDRLRSEGADPRLRLAADRSPYRTDNGNEILDVAWPGGVRDPAATEAALARLPGVVESGLFVGLATRVMVGHADGEVMERRPGVPPHRLVFD